MLQTDCWWPQVTFNIMFLHLQERHADSLIQNQHYQVCTRSLAFACSLQDKLYLHENSLHEAKCLTSHSRWGMLQRGENSPWWPTWREITLVCYWSEIVRASAHEQAKYCCGWSRSALKDPVWYTLHAALVVDIKSVLFFSCVWLIDVWQQPTSLVKSWLHLAVTLTVWGKIPSLFYSFTFYYSAGKSYSWINTDKMCFVAVWQTVFGCNVDMQFLELFILFWYIPCKLVLQIK